MFQFVGIAALIATAFVALRWGGHDERLAAFGFAIATLLSSLANTGNYMHVEMGILLVDVGLLGGLVWLALRSDRFWPMWAAAFQLVGTTVHIASMAEGGKSDFAWAYAVGLIFWSYPVMVALAAGTWLEGRFRTR